LSLGILGLNGNIVQMNELMIEYPEFNVIFFKKKLLTFAMMIKKQLYIYFLFAACLLQFGHSLFPHTHSIEHHHNGQQHHHHEEQSDENSLPLLFSHFNHTSDSFSNSHIEDVVSIVKEVPNQIVVLNSRLSHSNSTGFCTKKEVVRNKEPLIFISPHLLSLQFRGPPTLFS
jgi:hypothetical protein